MGILALSLLVGALGLSPYRYFLLPVALVVVMAFVRLRSPELALLALIPYAPLLNLEGLLTDTQLYPSEVVLLAAVGTAGLRRPGAVRLEGAVWLVLVFAAWMAIAAIAGSGLTDTARVTKLLRTAFLAAAAFAIGREAARRPGGAHTWIDSAAGAAGLFALLALGEAVLGLGPGVPRTGSPVGGPEMLAIHLTLLAPPGIALVALGADRSRATRFILLLVGLALLVSFSRSGWLGGWAAILGMGLLAGKADRRGAGRLKLAAVLLLVGAAGAALVFTLAPGVLGDYGARLRSISNPARFLADRQREWGAGLATIRAYPLFGHPDAPNPYNLVLALAAVSGIPILIPFAAMMVAAFRSGWHALEQVERATPAVGLLGAAIALLITGVGESSLGARVTPAAMATLGVLSGLGRENAPHVPRPAILPREKRTP